MRKLALHKSVFSLCTMLMEKSSSASKKSSIAQLIYTRLSAGTQQVWSAEAIRKLVFSTQSPAKWNKKTVENVEEALQVLRELTVV